MIQQISVPEKWQWFSQARYGLFLHWGPYAALGRGEQVLFREHMDPAAYERAACLWNPEDYDPRRWARDAKAFGMRYACLTARHHDGYCLWDSALTDYTSVRQAPGRDLVREYVEAFRAEGLKVGLYYSWLDWRVPAFFDGPEKDPAGWEAVRRYLHGQVEELLTRYGKIDYFFFDGAWPRTREELQSRELLAKMRIWQPDILVNNRLGDSGASVGEEAPGADAELGDFGTPEREIRAERTRLWESCDVSTQRLWGYGRGEYPKSAQQMLDSLCECAEKGGNLLMNIGPDGAGRFPEEVRQPLLRIGEWLSANGEAVYGTDDGDITEFLTHGRQTVRDNVLYLICKYWDGSGEIRVNDLLSPVRSVTLLRDGSAYPFTSQGDALVIHGLPREKPGDLFPVLRVECAQRPRTNEWGLWRNWQGDPARVADWARTRGNSVFVGR